jgi:hypothetical protein
MVRMVENRKFHKCIIITMMLPLTHDSAIRIYGWFTGNLEVMQMLQEAAFARYALGRDFAQQSVPACDLTAPPPPSQVFATGVASSRQTML